MNICVKRWMFRICCQIPTTNLPVNLIARSKTTNIPLVKDPTPTTHKQT